MIPQIASICNHLVRDVIPHFVPYNPSDQHDLHDSSSVSGDATPTQLLASPKDKIEELEESNKKSASETTLLDPSQSYTALLDLLPSDVHLSKSMDNIMPQDNSQNLDMNAVAPDLKKESR